MLSRHFTLTILSLPSPTITVCPKRHILVQCYQSFKTKQKSKYTKETVSSSGSYTTNFSPMLSVLFMRQTALCSGLFACVDWLVCPDTTDGRQRNGLQCGWLCAQNTGNKKRLKLYCHLSYASPKVSWLLQQKSFSSPSCSHVLYRH